MGRERERGGWGGRRDEEGMIQVKNNSTTISSTIRHYPTTMVGKMSSWKKMKVANFRVRGY